MGFFEKKWGKKTNGEVKKEPLLLVYLLAKLMIHYPLSWWIPVLGKGITLLSG